MGERHGRAFKNAMKRPSPLLFWWQTEITVQPRIHVERDSNKQVQQLKSSGENAKNKTGNLKREHGCVRILGHINGRCHIGSVHPFFASARRRYPQLLLLPNLQGVHGGGYFLRITGTCSNHRPNPRAHFSFVIRDGLRNLRQQVGRRGSLLHRRHLLLTLSFHSHLLHHSIQLGRVPSHGLDLILTLLLLSYAPVAQLHPPLSRHRQLLSRHRLIHNQAQTTRVSARRHTDLKMSRQGENSSLSPSRDM